MRTIPQQELFDRGSSGGESTCSCGSETASPSGLLADMEEGFGGGDGGPLVSPTHTSQPGPQLSPAPASSTPAREWSAEYDSVAREGGTGGGATTSKVPTTHQRPGGATTTLGLPAHMIDSRPTTATTPAATNGQLRGLGGGRTFGESTAILPSGSRVRDEAWAADVSEDDGVEYDVAKLMEAVGVATGGIQAVGGGAGAPSVAGQALTTPSLGLISLSAGDVSGYGWAGAQSGEPGARGGEARGDVGHEETRILGTREVEFDDPIYKILDFLLSLTEYKVEGETELDTHLTIRECTMDFHDSHGSLMKVRILMVKGQAYIHPPVRGINALKRFGAKMEVMITGYDPMSNSQEEILHPLTAAVTMKREYSDPLVSDWSLLHIHSSLDSVSFDVSSGLLQLVSYIINTGKEILDREEGWLGTHNSLRVYNDLHAEILVMHKQRTRDKTKTWRYHKLMPNQWLLAPTSLLFFSVRKYFPRQVRGEAEDGSDEEGGVLRSPSLHLNDEEDVREFIDSLMALGTTRQKNQWLKDQEPVLLFGSTRVTQLPLELLADDMPLVSGDRMWLGERGVPRTSAEQLLQLMRREPGWCNLGRLHADYSNCRCYYLQNAGYKVLVEPFVDRVRGVWSLTVGSCVQIQNSCAMPLRIYEGRNRTYLQGVANSCCGRAGRFEWKRSGERAFLNALAPRQRLSKQLWSVRQPLDLLLGTSSSQCTPLVASSSVRYGDDYSEGLQPFLVVSELRDIVTLRLLVGRRAPPS